MLHVLQQLNYLAILVTSVAGITLGWIWYSQLLFAQAWMDETKFTPEAIKAKTGKGIGGMFFRSFVHMLLSTFGLSVILHWQGVQNGWHGAGYGLFVGVFLIGVRLVNGGMWEQRTFKLQCITIGHEVALFTLQGALLAVWK
ncbi:DUF1761 domain-containing protein [Oleiharenicola lentus]|uniref:DUF1761 domain-containing protein n=1 Tax=Oleiharenicola lentus TaxID=2508720 RepID=UPI003F66A161